MVQGRAFITFTVECSKTQPGQIVFLVGDHEAIGSWMLADALPMSTTPSTFPLWSSTAILLPAGRAIAFKFVILQGDFVLWEDFPGNRSLEVTPGAIMAIRCNWDDLSSIRVLDSASKPSLPHHDMMLVAPAGQVEDGGLTKRSMSQLTFSKAELERVSNSFTEREPLRRNFSQTLLCADAEIDSDEESGPVRDLLGDEGRCNDESLKRITSYSALTEPAGEDVKHRVRSGRKAQCQYMPYNRNVPVVIVSSEVAPYSKSGGLGLVTASYSYEFARNGHRTMAISPKYQHYEGISYIDEARVRVDGRDETVRYWHKYVDYGDNRGCDYVFVEHPCIERAGGGIYNDNDGREYGDNLLRFTLLCQAAMEAPLTLHIGGYPFGNKVLFLANDWQSGLVPVYLNYKYRRHGCYPQARCIYVIHNLGYQGQYPHVDACHFFGIEEQAACDMVFGNCVNLTKGALICADRVLTVSPNYAREIQTKEGGFGLEDFVRGKAHGLRLGGILNGIDDCWNPEIDDKIARKFSLADFEEGKCQNKSALQRMLGLRQDPHPVLVGFVGRLAWQKGVDVMGSIISWLMTDTGNGVTGHVQLIMMGNGEEVHARTLRWAEGAHKGCVCGYVGFDTKVEHQMMAGCDLLLMPSRYEPCGLPQMYSQQYGTLPIVAATGGLVDSVHDVSEGLEVATGFHVPYLSSDKLKGVMYKAMEMYLKRPNDFRHVQRNAMQMDFYWPKAIDQYEQNIDYTLYDPPLVR